MKTYMAKKEAVRHEWLLVDAADRVLGRMAVAIARLLMGKHKATYTRHVDTGAFVVVTNVSKIRVTGKKLDTKVYKRYSGYPGGLKETPMRTMMARKPDEVLRLAVRRMLPKGALGNKMLKKLKIYAGPDHPHQAQEPVETPLSGKGIGG